MTVYVVPKEEEEEEGKEAAVSSFHLCIPAQKGAEILSSYHFHGVFNSHLMDGGRLFDGHLLELLVELALHAVPDRIEHGVHRHLGLVRRLGPLLEDARAHEDRVPGVVGLAGLVEVVGPADVGLGCVADEVDGVGGLVDAVGIFAPLLQEAGRELEGAELGFAKGDGLELLARDGLEHGLERRAEGAHSDAREAVVGGPDDVVVGEEDGWAFPEGLRPRTEAPVLAHAEIEDDLLVTCPISAVREDKDRLDFHFAVISRPGMRDFVLRQLPERSGMGIVLDDVAWRNDILKAVSFGNLSALLALPANDEDGLVFFRHLSHRCVSADELARRDFDVELGGQLYASFFFRLAAAVCDKDVWPDKQESAFIIDDWTSIID